MSTRDLKAALGQAPVGETRDAQVAANNTWFDSVLASEDRYWIEDRGNHWAAYDLVAKTWGTVCWVGSQTAIVGPVLKRMVEAQLQALAAEALIDAAGVKAIIALQAFAGITESPETATQRWQTWCDEHRQETMDAYEMFIIKGSRHQKGN